MSPTGVVWDPACTMHKGPEGIWYAYAQWPSAEVRRAAFEGPALDVSARDCLREAIAESFDEIVLEPVADLLVLKGK